MQGDLLPHPTFYILLDRSIPGQEKQRQLESLLSSHRTAPCSRHLALHPHQLRELENEKEQHPGPNTHSTRIWEFQSRPEPTQTCGLKASEPLESFSWEQLKLIWSTPARGVSAQRRYLSTGTWRQFHSKNPNSLSGDRKVSSKTHSRCDVT